MTFGIKIALLFFYALYCRYKGDSEMTLKRGLGAGHNDGERTATVKRKEKRKLTKEKVTKEKKKYSRMGSILYALKNIWGINRMYLVFVLIGGPILTLNPLVNSYFTKVIIDELTLGSTFVRVATVMVMYSLLLSCINLAGKFVLSRIDARRYYVTGTYQSRMERKHFTTDYQNTENQDYRRVQGFAGRDSCMGDAAVEYVGTDLLQFLAAVFGIVACASMMAAVNPILFAVIAVVAVLSAVISRWQTKYYEKNKDKWEKEERKKGYLENISKDFTMAKDIKLYGMENWIDKMMRDYQKYILMWSKRCSFRGFLASLLAGILTLLQNGTAYLFLLGMLLGGKISVGDFVFFFSLVGVIAQNLQSVLGMIVKLVERADKIAYYREFFDYPDKNNHGKGCELPEAGKAVTIELKNVHYRYDGAEEDTLKGINLTIGEGEKLALVGMNGAGKTTLVKLICGFYHPTQGEILVNGKRIEEYNIEEYYSLISAVFQDMYLVALTIFKFVASVDLSRKTAREDAENALKKAGLWEKVANLENGMDTHLMKGVYEDGIDLSGGELQKLMLARAIYKDGCILVLDEPTAALDPIAENELYLKYNELTQGKTSLYISHRFASTRFCDRIVLLENGVITESGSHKELMEKGGRYAYMYEVQSQYYKEEAVNA
ncbi:MAG: ABC transporter ATP-binding protein [Lachnospiraceae bacterium]|nr:ABC transporter ATP-binding protein [Lachnospiraceae bacterium]